MKQLTIHSNIHCYQVAFSESTAFMAPLIADPSAVFIVDSRVRELYSPLFEPIQADRLMCVDALEQGKNFEGVFAAYRFLLARNSKRNTHLVSIGGGIIQDITGFAASTLYRGIRWTFIPTTLLAQADSCVGSKTSLNFENYKNIVGSFYPPNNVVVSSHFLASLSDAERHSGIGEIIKFLLLDDRKPVDISFIESLVRKAYQTGVYGEAIYESLGVKQSYIAQDEFDTGKRNLFNYGHCFGHALEASSEFRVPHGIAVIYGMWFANLLAEQRGYLTQARQKQLYRRLFAPYLSCQLKDSDLDAEKLIAALKQDKKRSGDNLALVVPSSDQIEAIKLTDVTEQEVRRCLLNFSRQLEAA